VDAKEVQLLQELFAGPRVLSLAVLVDGAPLVGLLPFAVKPDFSAAIVHASQLARHAKGLVAGAPFGILIHASDSDEGDARQVARVSLEGEVHPLAEGTAAFDKAVDLYLERFPDSGPVFALGDFGLYELRFAKGRLVGGAGRAFNLTAENLREAAARG
jgi:putative heme iron utilization protein